MNLVDIATYGPIIILTIIIFWLYNKEIRKSLEQSRLSEESLAKDRDNLKIIINERTKELRDNRMKRMGELAKAAEFGRLSQGLFHDLMTPLTSMVLHAEKNAEKIKDTKALEASKRMTAYIKDIRSTLSQEESDKICRIEDELDTILHLLEYKARENNIEFIIYGCEECTWYGNPIKLRQIFSNLISNAIDSFENIEKDSKKEIYISINQSGDKIIIKVKDNGCGIDKNILEKVFDPFFSTKSMEKGTGIGLTTVKSIVENNFKGKIEVQSEKNIGTTFTIII